MHCYFFISGMWSVLCVTCSFFIFVLIFEFVGIRLPWDLHSRACFGNTVNFLDHINILWGKKIEANITKEKKRGQDREK